MEKPLKPSFENVDCDICQENNYDIFIQIPDYDDYLSSSLTLSIVKCKSCGLLYTNPRINQGAMEKLGEMRFTPWTKDKSRFRLWLSALIRKHPKIRTAYHYFTGEYLSEIIAQSKGRVLDIGCGFGDLLEDLLKKGCIPYGIEVNPFAVKAGREKGLQVSQGTLEKIRFPDNFFDTITLRHVIEHLDSPREALAEALRVLKPQGQMFIYCPNADSYFSKLFGKYWWGWGLPFHYYHFTLKTMHRLIATTGFRVRKIETVTPEYIFLMSLARYLKHRQNRFLLCCEKKGIFSNLFFRLFISSIFRILDLCFPGGGECLRVELVKPDGQ